MRPWRVDGVAKTDHAKSLPAKISPVWVLPLPPRRNQDTGHVASEQDFLQPLRCHALVQTELFQPVAAPLGLRRGALPVQIKFINAPKFLRVRPMVSQRALGCDAPGCAAAAILRERVE